MVYEKLRSWITSQSYDFEEDLKVRRTIEELEDYGRSEIEGSIKEKILEKFPDDRQAFGASKAINKVGIEKFSDISSILRKRDLRLGRLRSIKRRKEEAEELITTREERSFIKEQIRKGRIRSASGIRKVFRVTEDTAEIELRLAEQSLGQELAEQAKLA